jgi:MFS family permease
MSVTPRAYGNANAMALLMAAFTEGDRRNRALGYWGAVGSAVAIVGQLLGGVNVPIGIVTIAAPCSCHIAQRVRRPAGHSRLLRSPLPSISADAKNDERPPET